MEVSVCIKNRKAGFLFCIKPGYERIKCGGKVGGS